MDRLLSRAAVAALCAAWLAGCGSTKNADLKTPAPTGVDQPAAAELPTTLEGEIARAHDLREKGSYESATRALAQLMLVAPDNPKVVGEYGKALLQEGKSGEAAPFLVRAIELQGSDWTLYSALGVAYDQADDHTKAKLAYEHALELKPHAPDVLNNYAVSRMLAGDTNGAERLFAEASAAGADSKKIANNLEILASMKRDAEAKAAAHAPAPTTVASVAPAAVSQPAPVAVHKPQSIITATALPPPAPVATTTHHSASAPKQVANVVMQKVPVDPYAGPVQTKTVADKKNGQAVQHKTKLAAVATAKTKVVADAKPVKTAKVTSDAKSLPVLRTAADGQ